MLTSGNADQANTSYTLTDHHTQPAGLLVSHDIVQRMDRTRCGGFSTKPQWVPIDDQKRYTDIALLLSIELDLIRLDDHPQTVVFTNPDGTPGSYTFAFVAHLSDGRRLAIAVEEEPRGSSDARVAYFQSIKSLIPKSFADGIALFTERRTPSARHVSIHTRNGDRCGLSQSTVTIGALETGDGA